MHFFKRQSWQCFSGIWSTAKPSTLMNMLISHVVNPHFSVANPYMFRIFYSSIQLLIEFLFPNFPFNSYVNKWIIRSISKERDLIGIFKSNSSFAVTSRLDFFLRFASLYFCLHVLLHLNRMFVTLIFLPVPLG